jgi:hypothetical protein
MPVEKLAELEHLQWAHWTKYFLDNLTPENISRWRRQMETPYNELTESEKDADRKWARLVLAAIG